MGIEEVRAALIDDLRIRVAYIFGSAVGDGLRPRSDLDIAVLFADRPPPRVLDELTEDLSHLAGRAVDLVDLTTAPSLLAHEVVARGRCILARDETERVAFEDHAIHRFVDTAHLRRIQREALRARVGTAQ
jgi:uncharacterized protein